MDCSQLQNGGSFQFVFCKRLPVGKPPFSYGFPMVFPLKPSFSYGFPMVFPLKPSFSYGFPMVFPLKPSFSYGFPIKTFTRLGRPFRHKSPSRCSPKPPCEEPPTPQGGEMWGRQPARLPPHNKSNLKMGIRTGQQPQYIYI